MDTTATPSIDHLIEPTLNELGFELVRVRFLGSADKRTLQVMAEPLDRSRTMTVDDCAEISRAISAILDVADPVSGHYLLEVSSPGIDRPLVRLKDFERFEGFEARVELTVPIEGQRRFKGRVLGVEDEDVLLDEAGATRRLPFADLHKAKLVVTDDLLKAGAKARRP